MSIATVAVDAMGGDHAPRMVIEGVLMAALHNPQVAFVLVGLEEVILEELKRAGVPADRFMIQPASEVVGMGEKPALALRNKKDSSLRVCANMVKEKRVDAFVSAGNTGALMATAKYVLKTLPGIDRPAIASVVPSIPGRTLMLDLGANVDCTADHLCQFARMGRVYAHTLLGLQNPRIGLLNIGEESVKGNEVVKLAGERLKVLEPNFIGNVEANIIFVGGVDVVVCDGFVGNISLKTGEGVVQMLAHFLKEAFSHSWFAKLSYLVASPALKRFRAKVDPRKFNGALLLGLNGIVVKSHGSADAYAYSYALQVAIDLAVNRVNEKICNAPFYEVAAAPSEDA
ncbi:MAG: phosphate acyltransferase PlsX [Magnetococcus sp. DMHC-6]